MKLAYINPVESGAWFKDGRCRKVGAWTYTDVVDSNGMHRFVAHHGTIMGEFVSLSGLVWGFAPLSIGWGSVSDQNGMNKIMPSGWRYRRNGGNPRYECHGEVHKFSNR